MFVVTPANGTAVRYPAALNPTVPDRTPRLAYVNTLAMRVIKLSDVGTGVADASDAGCKTVWLHL